MATATEVTTRYRKALSLAVEASLKEMLRLLRPLTAGNVDGWWATNSAEIEGIVATGHDVTASLAARYLRDHALTAGKKVLPTLVKPSPEQIATALRVTGPVAFKQQMLVSGLEDAARRVMIQRVTGAGRRLILAGARSTTEATVSKSKVIVGYQRVTSGSPCAFCAMLASRGAVYKSERTAGEGNAYHDSCACTAAPLYSRSSTPAPFAAEWAQAKSLAGEQGVSQVVAFRRLIEGRTQISA